MKLNTLYNCNHFFRFWFFCLWDAVVDLSSFLKIIDSIVVLISYPVFTSSKIINHVMMCPPFECITDLAFNFRFMPLYAPFSPFSLMGLLVILAGLLVYQFYGSSATH